MEEQLVLQEDQGAQSAKFPSIATME
jgi:hypothetical protein